MVGRIPTGFRTVSLRDLQIVKDASALVLRTAPRRAGIRASSAIVINDNIAAITFGYLSPKGVWTETWRGRNLPVAIRFTLSVTRAEKPETVSGLALLRLASTSVQDD